LSEIILASILVQKENQAKQQRLLQESGSPTSLQPGTLASGSRAITIVDPTSRTPLYLPSSSTATKASPTLSRSGRYSGSTTPATAGFVTSSTDSYFALMPSNAHALPSTPMRPTHQPQQQPQQQLHHQHHQQQQALFNGMYGSHAYGYSPHMLQQQQQQQQHHHHQHQQVSQGSFMMSNGGLASPTGSSVGSYSPPRVASRIPIINPDNGTVVSVPETPAGVSSVWNQHRFVAVR
ncbi:hypothetical protein BGW38_008762, partial [Lunasporangiospora selenospora]